MDARYINAFISDVDQILGVMAPDVHLIRQSPCMKQSPIITNSIVVIIGINGQVKGQVIFTFHMEWGLYLAGQMCCGTVFPVVDDMVLSALGELSNMLSARAITNIQKLTGEVADITPPTSLHSTGAVNIQIATPIICIPYKNVVGNVFEINFAIRR